MRMKRIIAVGMAVILLMAGMVAVLSFGQRTAIAQEMTNRSPIYPRTVSPNQVQPDALNSWTAINAISNGTAQYVGQVAGMTTCTYALTNAEILDVVLIRMEGSLNNSAWYTIHGSLGVINTAVTAFANSTHPEYLYLRPVVTSVTMGHANTASAAVACDSKPQWR